LSELQSVGSSARQRQINFNKAVASASAKLRKTLARYFDVARGAVFVEAGEASRTKRIRVRGVSAADALAKVAGER